MRGSFNSRSPCVALIGPLLLVAAHASGQVNQGAEGFSARADINHPAGKGDSFSLTLIPRQEVTASAGGLFHLTGVLSKLAGPNDVFSDSFESGDTSAWSSTIPPPGEMPSGAVVFLDATECPSGWSPFIALQGRGVTGVPSAGTIGGVSGSSMGNLGSPVHGHSVIGSFATAQYAAHGHRWSVLDAEKTWISYSQDHKIATLIEWQNGIDNAGSGHFLFAAAHDTIHATNKSGAHSHGLTMNRLTGYASVTTPYLQLLACEKD